LIRYLRDDVLQTYLVANTKTRLLGPDGVYRHLSPGPGDAPLNPQDWLIQYHQRSKG
jgi:hypothetical protein